MNNLTITTGAEQARTIRMRLDGTNLLDEDLDAVLTAATDDPVTRERLASELGGGEILTFQSHARWASEGVSYLELKSAAPPADELVCRTRVT